MQRRDVTAEIVIQIHVQLVVDVLNCGSIMSAGNWSYFVYVILCIIFYLCRLCQTVACLGYFLCQLLFFFTLLETNLQPAKSRWTQEHNLFLWNSKHNVLLGNSEHNLSLGNLGHNLSLGNSEHNLSLGNSEHNLSLGNLEHNLLLGNLTFTTKMLQTSGTRNLSLQ